MSHALTCLYLAPTHIGALIELEVRNLSVGRTVCLLGTDVYELTGRDGTRTVKTATSAHTKIDVSLRRATKL